MIVVDTSILVAIIREEDEAAFFTDILDETEAIMSVVSYVETHMVVAGRKLDANLRRVELTTQDLGIEVVDVTRDQADAAVRAFLQYGKGRHRDALISPIVLLTHWQRAVAFRCCSRAMILPRPTSSPRTRHKNDA